MTTFLVMTSVLILSNFFTKVLIAGQVKKYKRTIKKSLRKRLKKLCQREQQLALDRQALQQIIIDYEEKEAFVKGCYEKAEAIAQKAKRVEVMSANKICFLSKQIEHLKSQLKQARQNVKRRKKQLKELKD